VSATARGSRFSVEVPLSTAMPARVPQRDLSDVDRGRLAGVVVLCIDNELTILDGMETLLGGWGCRVVKAPDLATALAALDESNTSPDALLVDYHLGGEDGLAAIDALRRRYGADATAILITADRSPAVREQARAHDVQVLNKPLKPAALRALLAQCRVQRVVAAAE
jgi:CheY-like chemotaxis protein